MVGSTHGPVVNVPVVPGDLTAPTRSERVVLARIHQSLGDGHAHQPRRRPSHRIRRGSSKPVLSVCRAKDLSECAFRGFVDHVGVGDEVRRQIIEDMKRRYFQQTFDRGDDLANPETLTLLQPWHGRCHNVLKYEVRGCRSICWVGEGQGEFAT